MVSRSGPLEPNKYFSFVSITTMGYGDVLPVSEIARSAETFEGVFGTLSPAAMIARLVGLHGSTPSEASSTASAVDG